MYICIFFSQESNRVDLATVYLSVRTNPEISESIKATKMGLGMLFLQIPSQTKFFQQRVTPTNDRNAKICICLYVF